MTPRQRRGTVPCQVGPWAGRVRLVTRRSPPLAAGLPCPCPTTTCMRLLPTLP